MTGADAAADAEQGLVIGAGAADAHPALVLRAGPARPAPLQPVAPLRAVPHARRVTACAAPSAPARAPRPAALRFERGAEGWRQFERRLGGRRALLQAADISDLDEAAQAGALEAEAARVQRSLDLARGPLLKVVLFDLGAGRNGRLLLVVASPRR